MIDKKKYISKFHIPMKKVEYIYNWVEPVKLPANIVRENKAFRESLK